MTKERGASMTKIEIDKLIENWTQTDRGEIHSALAALRVGAVKLDDTSNTWCMTLADTIPARNTRTIQARGYIAMKASKLVILEPTFERVEHETIVERSLAQVEKNWFRTRIVKPEVITSRSIEHKSLVTVARSVWRVRGMFVGSCLQFPLEKDISGDLFGPDGMLTLSSTVLPGLDATVSIENTTSQELPFYAVLLGQLAKEESKSSEVVDPAAAPS